MWVRGNGRHRGDGLPAGAQHHGSFVWAAAAHGWVSNHYTEHLQTDKKNKPVGHKRKLLLSFTPHFLLLLCSRVFPRGRSGWLLTPQTSPDACPPPFRPHDHHHLCVCRQEPGCKILHQALRSIHLNHTLSSRVPLKAIRLKSIFDFHTGRCGIFLGFEATLEQVSKKSDENTAVAR